MIYSGAKRRREEKRGEMDASGGLTIEEGADYAMKMFGAKSGPFRLRTLADIISWLQISPVVIGFEWTAGVENPHTKGGVFGFFFGARWIKPDKEDSKKIKYGNHAVAITGASFKRGGYVRVQNSRGMNWGNKGTARLAWSDLEDMLRRRKAIAYGIEWNERGNTRAQAKATLATHEPS